MIRRNKGLSAYENEVDKKKKLIALAGEPQSMKLGKTISAKFYQFLLNKSNLIGSFL